MSWPRRWNLGTLITIQSQRPGLWYGNPTSTPACCCLSLSPSPSNLTTWILSSLVNTWPWKLTEACAAKLVLLIIFNFFFQFTFPWDRVGQGRARLETGQISGSRSSPSLSTRGLAWLMQQLTWKGKRKEKREGQGGTDESCHVQLPCYCHLPAAWLPALL